MKKIFTILFFLLCLSIPVILPFFHAGYFPTHDGEWAVVRLADMFRTLRDFQIPARYSGNLNFGYGYPLFNFTYPLPYYLGLIVYLLGAGFVGAIKILFAVSVILSAFFMFFASARLWKSSWAGIISAILYIYFPYRMVDLYVRGSLGESLSFVLFPLLFYLAIKLINKHLFLLAGGIVVSIACLVMSHNIMTVLFVPAYVVLILSQAILKNKKAIKSLFLSIILGFGLASFFWLPALFEKSNILLSQTPIADRNLYFVTLGQLIFPGWGYGAPTDLNGFSYQLGLVHLAIIIIVVLTLLFSFVKNRKYFEDYYVKFAGIIIIISAFYFLLLFKPSEILWKNMPLLSEINYPWISLGILGFLISLLAGFLGRRVPARYAGIALGIIAILIVLPYAEPQKYIDRGDDYYLTNDATTTSSNELMPLWVEKMPLRRAEKKVELISGNGEIENVFFNSKQITFSVNALSQSVVRVNTIYFPGWSATVDKTNAPISYANEKGVMDIPITSGRHAVSVDFRETQLRLISDMVSISSFFIVLFLILKRNKYAFS